MSNDRRAALQQEWCTLHNNCERSEALSLVIKLVAVIVCILGIIVTIVPLVTALLLLVLWFQDAIWKTFQARTEQHLLLLEQCWADTDTEPTETALSLYTTWQTSRPGTIALVSEYFRSALKPTVAYPYAILILIGFIQNNL